MREHTFNGSVQQSCCIFGYGGARLWKTLSCWSNILQYGKRNVLVLYGLWQKVSGFGRIAGTGSCLLEKSTRRAYTNDRICGIYGFYALVLPVCSGASHGILPYTALGDDGIVLYDYEKLATESQGDTGRV